MTALSLELMDITRDWFSSFVMLCQAFTAADFSCCLFVGLSAFVFSKWNACSIGLRSGDWLVHCRIFHFFTFKNSWVAFAVCFGFCTMKCHPINFAPFVWIWADSIFLYTSEFFRLILSSVTSSLNTNNQCHWKPCMLMPSHCSTMFHRCCYMLWIMSCSKPSFWYRLILISAVQRMLFQKWSGFFLFLFCLAKSNLALFAPCGEPSVFALVKSSLDCGLWQWHVYLLESVLHLAGCCERVFLYHGEDPPFIYHCCPLWTSRAFYVAELSSAFFFSQNVPNCWCGHS